MNNAGIMRACGLGALLFCGSAAADSAGSTALAMNDLPLGYAAATYNSPVAFGSSWGSFGVGVMNLWGGHHDDASMAADFGLGNPDTVAADVDVVLSSLSKSDGGPYGFGEEGSVAFKLHRNLGDYTAIALGTTALGRWGGDVFFDHNPQGHYLAVTHALFLGDTVLMLTGGAGDDVVHKSSHPLDPFGSAALYVKPWASVIAEYNGFTTNVALSVAPLPQWLPLTITCGAVDVDTRHNDKFRVLGLVSLGYHL